MSTKKYYSIDKKKDYLDLFLGLSEENFEFEKKEAIEYFIELLRQQRGKSGEY